MRCEDNRGEKGLLARTIAKPFVCDVVFVLVTTISFVFGLGYLLH
jgi:hypothetical protein